MTNADWWAKKLQNNAPQPRRDVSPPMPPSQQPMTRYTPPQPLEPASKAQSAKQTQSCPECYSNNYMAIQNAAPRCYDCGYPLSQSGSRYGSLTGAQVEGAVKSSLGNNSQSNWNPQNIIGRVDG
jgi:hypothetical protein